MMTATFYKQLLDRWTNTLNCVFIYDYDPGNSLVNLLFPAIHNLKHDMPYFRSRGTWGLLDWGDKLIDGHSSELLCACQIDVGC